MTSTKLSAKKLNEIMVALGHLLEPATCLSVTALVANFLKPDSSQEEISAVIGSKNIIQQDLETPVSKILFSVINGHNELGVELQNIHGTGGVPHSEIDLKGQKVSALRSISYIESGASIGSVDRTRSCVPRCLPRNATL